MGLSFKKLGRGISRIAKKNARGAGRLVKKYGPGLVAATVLPTAAPLIAGAHSKLKTAGKKLRGIETPKSLVDVVKLSEARVARTRQKMPGGAPIPTIGRPTVSLMSSSPQAKRSLYKAKKKRARKDTGEPSMPVKTAAQRKKWLKAIGATEDPARTARLTTKTKRRITKPPTAKQLAARERFKKMVAERRKRAG